MKKCRYARIGDFILRSVWLLRTCGDSRTQSFDMNGWCVCVCVGHIFASRPFYYIRIHAYPQSTHRHTVDIKTNMSSRLNMTRKREKHKNCERKKKRKSRCAARSSAGSDSECVALCVLVYVAAVFTIFKCLVMSCEWYVWCSMLCRACAMFNTERANWLTD